MCAHAGAGERDRAARSGCAGRAAPQTAASVKVLRFCAGFLICGRMAQSDTDGNTAMGIGAQLCKLP